MIVEEKQLTEGNISPYSSSLEHLLDRIRLLDVRLQMELQRVERKIAKSDARLRGLAISREDLEEGVFDHDLQQDSSTRLNQALDGLESLVNARIDQTSGIELRLERLRLLFGLSEFEVDVLTLCVAPEIDIRYEITYAYIQNDTSKKRPTLDLALNLFCDSLSERIEKRNLLATNPPLLRNSLVRLSGDGSTRERVSLGSFLVVEQRVLDYLLGVDTIDGLVYGITQVKHPQKTWEDLVFQPEFIDQLKMLPGILQDCFGNDSGVILQLVGSTGTGRKTIAEVLCKHLDRRLLSVDSTSLLGAETPTERLIKIALRETALQEAIVYFDNFDVLLGPGTDQRLMIQQLVRSVAAMRSPVMVGIQNTWQPGGEMDGCRFLDVQVPRPEYAQRRRLWINLLSGNYGEVTEEQVDLLAGKFRLKGGQIQQVVTTANSYAWLRESQPALTVNDLNTAARRHSDQRIGDSAQKIHPRYSWEDIVLPADQKAQLREACSYFANMALVYEGWGFQSKTSLGKGLNILFAGSSGTGKTMAADIMAGELGLDLYKIDLSGIVSKYIGETEKNLDRIFSEAQDSNAILFFDEADALFGKRSEVKDSHDRYANIEISYLLQKMDEYQGIVVLATNFRKNMDDAFVRRMHFALEFPVPEENDRLEIWNRVFPNKAPLGSDVDLNFLARQFKIAGGNIKNIAVNSAFLAAQNGRLITMEHVILSAKREYQKMGKLLIENDFGEYFDLVKANPRVQGA